MTVARGAPLRIDDLLDAAACAGLMGLASATVDGAPIGVVDLEGRLVIGEHAGPIAARRHPIGLDGTLLGAIEAPEQVPESLLALLAKSLELTMDGARQAAAHARMEHELSIGRRIQLALLPHRFPEVDGWSFAAAYEAAREVGGDLYDAFPVRGKADRVGLVVADVTGKGIPAALLMADCRALLHAATDNAPSPGDALARVNRILVTERPTSLFVTAFLGVLETATGILRYASAGHEPPSIVRRSGELERLELAGPLLGAFAQVDYEDGEVELSAGDVLAIHTDGITDARDPGGAFFGEERLESTLRAAAGSAPEVVATSLVEAVRVFRAGADPFDDLCLLLVGRDPA
jgi:sigma-B regulation protein RsbU (phosphoserine phosphatase)